MKIVEKNRLNELMKAVLDSGKVLIAPVKEGKTSRYEAITDPSKADLEIPITKMSIKEHFLPPTECILIYEKQGDEIVMHDPEPPKEDRVIFGARPCDAAAMAIMDKVFTWDYQDSIYLARREKTTIVSIACDSKQPSCHCEDVGLSPMTREGSDVILISLDANRYWVEPVTDKGKKLVELWGNKLSDAPGAEKKSIPEPKKLKPEDLDKLFESPKWAELTMKCLGCGVCAYVCPTCHCFDIVDEENKEGGGTRRRNWDVCALSVFTKHGGGHNPRPEQWERYRQRLMHKFDYYPEKFGCIACVGCGRCVMACPVNMDIFDILEKVKSE